MKITHCAVLSCLALAGVSTLQAPVRAQESDLEITSPVPFKRIAQVRFLKAKTKGYGAESAYPKFYANNRLARFVNKSVGHAQRQTFANWVAQTKKSLQGKVSPAGPYQYLSTPSMSFYSPRLISLEFNSYEFTGGAHGMNVSDARNFGIIGGKPKEIVLGDLFKPGTKYRELVQTKILAKLKKDPAAMWVHDGSVKKLETAQFNNFSIGKGGLTWTFNPYEMGPYANGSIETRLSFDELGSGLRDDLLK
jgi:hypothetical protein